MLTGFFFLQVSLALIFNFHHAKKIGIGSCGIGVVMAARDIISDCALSVYNFQWQYCDMDLHRKDLMLQILNWGSA